MENSNAQLSSMDDSKKLQVAIFPWLGFGHIIPFLQFAEKIAQKGHKVFFISTPRNIKRLPKIPESLRPLINLVQIPLPHVENLPENAEATMDIPNFLIPQLKKAQDGLQEEITHFLQSQSPDWIVYDIIHHWLPPIATKLGVSPALFSVCTVSSVSFFEPTKPNPLDFSSSRTELEHFTVPPKWIPFPSKLFLRPYEANKLIPVLEDNEFRFRSAVEGCKVCLVRSCPLIEEEWINLFKRLHEKPVVPVGLLLPSAQPSNEESDKSWENISEWLDRQKKETLIYVALGSELNLSQQDLNELALGLELSGLPFFWALRMQNCSVKLPDGFEERTKGRGVVWTSWVPQLRVLAHESIGAFLTHCGSGSFLEGLHFGRPLVMLPYFGDQPLNARIFDNKVGVEIPRNEQDGSFTKEAVAELVRLVLVGEEGKLFRDEAKKISVIVGDVTLNDGYIDECVKYFEMK